MSRQPRRTSLGGEERSFNSACGCERNTGRLISRSIPKTGFVSGGLLWNGARPIPRAREHNLENLLMVCIKKKSSHEAIINCLSQCVCLCIVGQCAAQNGDTMSGCNRDQQLSGGRLRLGS